MSKIIVIKERITFKGLFFLSLILNLILLIIIVIGNSTNFSNESLEQGSTVILGDFKLSYHNRLEELEQSNSCQLENANYLFLGDSITNRYNLDKYFSDIPFVNSGMEGDKTSDILNNMQERVYNYNPTKVFLLVGTNQLETDSEEEIFSGIKNIVENIKDNRAFADIYIESIYPVNNSINGPAKKKDNDKIKMINGMLKDYSLSNNVVYIDVYSSLLDEDGNLSIEYTKDGLHLNEAGYEKVTEVLKKYVEKC